MEAVKNDIKRTLRWVIVGPGQIAHQFVKDMPYASACNNEVVGVVSVSLTEARDFAREYHVPCYSDNLEKVLEQSSPDIAYIATPHAIHFRQAAACLRKKIPVLCEKPFALNEKQGSELIRLSGKYNTFFMEGMWIRFLPDIKQVVELLRQNIIGNINSLVADMSYRAPKDKHNRFYDPELGGGSLLDLGIYPVYLAMLTLGVPKKIKASALLSTESVDKSCAMILEYDNSAYALLESSIIKETGKTATFFGSLGRLVIHCPWNERPESIEVLLNDGTKEKYPCQWEGRGFQYEIDEVADCFFKGSVESALHSHTHSLTLLRLMDEIRSQTGIMYPADKENKKVL